MDCHIKLCFLAPLLSGASPVLLQNQFLHQKPCFAAARIGNHTRNCGFYEASEGENISDFRQKQTLLSVVAKREGDGEDVVKYHNSYVLNNIFTPNTKLILFIT